MARRVYHRRVGFTLIELLVVMAIIIGLAAITITVSTFALDRDRSVNAANQLQGSMQIARSRAHRDGLPHGIRLIDNGNRLATTYQFIHSPTVITPSAPGSLPGSTSVNSPYVQFEYPIDPTGQVPGVAPNNLRQCRIYNLTAAQQVDVTVNSILYLPDLGTYHLISLPITYGNPTTVTLNDASLLLGYPDAQMGAATHYRTYNFGLYGPPEPLVGEETRQLPDNSCVDLSAGRSSPQGNGGDYDILFAPSGKLVSTANTSPPGQMFLWVRDPNKPNNLNQGGEQFLVVAKAQSGAVGVAPVDFGADSYALGRKAVAGH